MKNPLNPDYARERAALRDAMQSRAAELWQRRRAAVVFSIKGAYVHARLSAGEPVTMEGAEALAYLYEAMEISAFLDIEPWEYMLWEMNDPD